MYTYALLFCCFLSSKLRAKQGQIGAGQLPLIDLIYYVFFYRISDRVNIILKFKVCPCLVIFTHDIVPDIIDSGPVVMSIMAIQVVEFSNGVYKIRKIFA